ncbi:hypothetical protein JMJ77_0010068 [Colletotrichum scovillei]|uniref:Uncharacterized protein n=1 Tax=Colletotrichum scovillei TaxID=1209932 RepID=A0A9P7QSY1_9PEZI|nr:hypothetical protein JMJ78_0001146 [Colletotrichum scovillei]KAG7040965.1 hypothetical protein JMJ77_0010068 [Colletotrichum scovillei]
MHLLGLVSICLLLTAHGTRSENRFRRPPGQGLSVTSEKTLCTRWESSLIYNGKRTLWQSAYSFGTKRRTRQVKQRMLHSSPTASDSLNESYAMQQTCWLPIAPRSDFETGIHFIQMFNHSDSVGDITCHYLNSTNSTLIEASPSVSPSSSGMNNGIFTGTIAGIAAGAVVGTLALIHLGHGCGGVGASDVRTLPALHEIGPSPPLRWKYELSMDAQQYLCEADGT